MAADSKFSGRQTVADSQFSAQSREDFQSVYIIYGRGSHLVHVGCSTCNLAKTGLAVLGEKVFENGGLMTTTDSGGNE